MQEATLLIEAGKVFGFPALLFAMWLIGSRAQEKRQKDAEDRLNGVIKNTSDTFNQLIKNQEKSSEQNFELLKEMIETNNYHGALLIRIEEHIRTNQYCPYVRKEFLPHESRNHAA